MTQANGNVRLASQPRVSRAFDIYYPAALGGYFVERGTVLPGDQTVGTYTFDPTFVKIIADTNTNPCDSDGNGIDDAIDTGGGSFDDGSGTSGQVLSNNPNVELLIVDLPDLEGVQITVLSGQGIIPISVCGESPPLLLTAGDVVNETCGSLITEVVLGSAENELDAPPRPEIPNRPRPS